MWLLLRNCCGEEDKKSSINGWAVPWNSSRMLGINWGKCCVLILEYSFPTRDSKFHLMKASTLRVGNILEYPHTISGTFLAHNPGNATWEAIARQRLTLDMLITMTEEKRIQPACHFSEKSTIPSFTKKKNNPQDPSGGLWERPPPLKHVRGLQNSQWFNIG